MQVQKHDRHVLAFQPLPARTMATTRHRRMPGEIDLRAPEYQRRWLRQCIALHRSRAGRELRIESKPITAVHGPERVIRLPPGVRSTGPERTGYSRASPLRSGGIVASSRTSPRLPQYRIHRPYQSEMFDDDKSDHTGDYGRRERQMRRDVVQGETVTGDEDHRSCDQHPEPLVTFHFSSVAAGDTASAKCASRKPTGPLSITFRPDELSRAATWAGAT